MLAERVSDVFTGLLDLTIKLVTDLRRTVQSEVQTHAIERSIRIKCKAEYKASRMYTVEESGRVGVYLVGKASLPSANEVRSRSWTVDTSAEKYTCRCGLYSIYKYPCRHMFAAAEAVSRFMAVHVSHTCTYVSSFSDILIFCRFLTFSFRPQTKRIECPDTCEELIKEHVPDHYRNFHILSALKPFDGQRVERSMIPVDVDVDEEKCVNPPKYHTDASKRSTRFKDASEFKHHGMIRKTQDAMSSGDEQWEREPSEDHAKSVMDMKKKKQTRDKVKVAQEKYTELSKLTEDLTKRMAEHETFIKECAAHVDVDTGMRKRGVRTHIFSCRLFTVARKRYNSENKQPFSLVQGWSKTYG